MPACLCYEISAEKKIKTLGQVTEGRVCKGSSCRCECPENAPDIKRQGEVDKFWAVQLSVTVYAGLCITLTMAVMDC